MTRLYEDIDIKEGILPSTITENKGSRDIDIRHINDCIAILQVGSVSGTSPTLDVKIQESDEPEFIDRDVLDVTPSWNKLLGASYTNIRINVYTFGTISNGSIKRVKLYLKRVGTIATGKSVWLSIEADDNGDPSGTPKGISKKVLCSDISTTSDWITFEFEYPVDLATGDHIVLYGDYTASDSNNIQVASNTVPSGGDFMHYSGSTPSWTAVSTKLIPIFIEYYVFSDIEGLEFSQKTTSGFEELFIDTSNTKRYIRAYFEVDGASPSFDVSLIFILGKAVYNPI